MCIVTAGGSAAGAPLIERAVAAFPDARRRVPNLRMVVIAGPRLATMPHGDGVEVRGYIHRLYRHLAASDVVISHGGLSTTMELTATRRPFLYCPLADHFEQNWHVDHRLRRLRAGRRMDFASASPELIADAIVDALETHLDYAAVTTNGAARAAEMIAELL